MDFGAEVAGRSYQEIPTGALRPRNDMLESAFKLNDILKFANTYIKLVIHYFGWIKIRGIFPKELFISA